MSESKTPRTDMVAAKAQFTGATADSFGQVRVHQGTVEYVSADFARTLESELTRLQVEKAEVERNYARVIDDVFEDMECDPACDSHGHTETCCATNGAMAVRKLRAALLQAAQRYRSWAFVEAALLAEHKRLEYPLAMFPQVRSEISLERRALLEVIETVRYAKERGMPLPDDAAIDAARQAEEGDKG